MPVLLAFALTVAGSAVTGCGRGAEYAAAGHSVSNGQAVDVLAPGGRLVTGKNIIRLRLTRTSDHASLDVTPRLGFAQIARGSVPLQVNVPLTRRGAGDFEGKVDFEAQGIWWADLTFDGPDGTQTMRVRVEVGK